jgi:hypothetical protein
VNPAVRPGVEVRMRRTRLATAALACAWALARAAAAPAAPEDVAGRYALRGAASVHAPSLLDGPVAASVDAVVAAAGRDVRIRLTWGRAVCEVRARLGADGALAFAPGQACDLALDEPEVRGRVLARVRDARGVLRGGAMSLEATCDLSGAASVRIAPRVDVPGTDMRLPGAWSPRTDVRGAAEVKLAGERLTPPR